MALPNCSATTPSPHPTTTPPHHIIPTTSTITDTPPYIPRKVDYLRDVFRPKPFVPEQATKAPTTVKHMSVYGGTHDQSADHLAIQPNGHHSLSQEEEKEAERLYQRIQQIEKMHPSPIDDCSAAPPSQWNDNEGNECSDASKSSIPNPSCATTPSVMQSQQNASDASEVRFLVDQCACAECSPVVLPDGSLFCDLCHVPILRDTWVAHMRSICHQMKRWNGVHQYMNPYMKPSSQGYQLMQSMGWKEGEGLGVQGQGRLEPLATRLKKNRLGIGAQDNTPLEVTHVERIDPVVEREKERLIRKYGKKRLNRLIKRYFRKKEQMESRKRDAWLHEEFRREWCVC